MVIFKVGLDDEIGVVLLVNNMMISFFFISLSRYKLLIISCLGKEKLLRYCMI